MSYKLKPTYPILQKRDREDLKIHLLNLLHLVNKTLSAGFNEQVIKILQIRLSQAFT